MNWHHVCRASSQVAFPFLKCWTCCLDRGWESCQIPWRAHTCRCTQARAKRPTHIIHTNLSYETRRQPEEKKDHSSVLDVIVVLPISGGTKETGKHARQAGKRAGRIVSGTCSTRRRYNLELCTRGMWQYHSYVVRARCGTHRVMPVRCLYATLEIRARPRTLPSHSDTHVQVKKSAFQLGGETDGSSGSKDGPRYGR